MVDIAKLDAIGGEYQCLHELVAAARAKLPDHSWDYLTGATETETTMRRNRAALNSLAFRPRVLRDVSRVDAAGPILGTLARLPVFLSPVGSLESFDAGGAATAARAVAMFGVPIMVSSVTQPGLEATAEAAPARRFFQLYKRGDEAFADDFIRRAVAGGYEAFCYTVNSAVYSRRERDITKRFAKPWRRGGAGMHFQAALAWDEIKRFKDNHSLPLIIKGIATSEDALIACEHGADVIYVSNHGGRQLDHGRGTLDVLPEIAAAVAGRARIFVDGGILPRQRHRQGARLGRGSGRHRPSLLLRSRRGRRGGRAPRARAPRDRDDRVPGPPRPHQPRRARPLLRPRGTPRHRSARLQRLSASPSAALTEEADAQRFL